MKINQKGFSVVEILIVIVIIGLVGVVGWLVLDRQNSKNDTPTNTTSTTQNSQQVKEVAEEEVPKQEEDTSSAPEGWIAYTDTASGVSFYHPADWEKSKFHVYKIAVSEIVKGTNFGPYSAKYIFNKSENKWYAIDSEGMQVAPYSGYTTVTTFPVSTLPAVYGYTGEGGGSSYYAVFTDGTSSYMIELPLIVEETNPTGLGNQKQAMPDFVKTIKLTN